MVVRVKVQVKKDNAVIETSAIANSGYETDVPEIHIPLALARELSFDLRGLTSTRYRVVGGFTNTLMVGEVLVRLVTEDKVTSWINAKAVSVLEEYEVLLSDKLLDALGIEIALVSLLHGSVFTVIVMGEMKATLLTLIMLFKQRVSIHHVN